MLRVLAPLALVFALSVALLPLAAGDHHGGNLVRGAAKDAIPAVTEPTFDTDEVYVTDDDLVIGVALNGDARAYPVKVLTRHEIVNDVVGGEPVAVTYCPLCGTGIVFDRTVDGDTLVFKVSGLLWNSDLVMYDTATESYWSQVEGLAIDGPFHGAVLDVVNARTITWRGWTDIHPDTKLLDRPFPPCPPGEDCPSGGINYDYDPYGANGYYDDPSIWFPVEHEDGQGRLHPKAMVAGVRLGGEARAYAFSLLERDRVINDVLGGVPLVVTFHDGSAQVFESGGAEFSYVSGRTMQEAEGTTYDLVTGEGASGALAPVDAIPSFWFAWFAFNPDTSLFLVPSTPSEVGGDGSLLWLVPVGLLIATGAGIVLYRWWASRR